MGHLETSNEFDRLSKITAKCFPTAYFVVDSINNILFLLDTGSPFSILPRFRFKPQTSEKETLKGITGHQLNVMGKLTLNIDIGFDVELSQEFVVAECSKKYGILGCDFFECNGLSLNSVESTLNHIPSGSITPMIKSEKKKIGR